jgi:hypothetical protein
VASRFRVGRSGVEEAKPVEGVIENPVREEDSIPEIRPFVYRGIGRFIKKTARALAGAALLGSLSLGNAYAQERTPPTASEVALVNYITPGSAYGRENPTSGAFRKQSAVEQSLLKMEGALKTFIHQDRIIGFYDYCGRHLSDAELVTLNPNRVEVPANAWARDRNNGFLGFIEATKELYGILGTAGTPLEDRQRVFNTVTRTLKENPYLQYQAFYDSPDGKLVHEQKDARGNGKTWEVQNNIFIQNMSRQLMTLAMRSFPNINPKDEKKQLSDALFPNSENGRAAAKLFEDTGLILAGFGLQGDTDRAKYASVNTHPGWKAVDGVLGGVHGGGVFDYAYFTTEYLAMVGGIHGQYPSHLILGDQKKPVTLVTAHGYRLIYEMDDFAAKYAPKHAGVRNILGYLYEQDLNTFASRTVDYTRDVETTRFSRKAGEKPSVEERINTQLLAYFHELLHKCNTRVQLNRPDLQQRLMGIIDLGERERSNIRDIEWHSDNFMGSGTPAYMWFKKNPAEAGATLANVAYVDPSTTLKWCASTARGGDGKGGVVQPLNHLLWLLDVNSLDKNFRETDRTFLFTLQPNGIEARKVDINLKRDAKGRISTLGWKDGEMQLTYGADGFARIKL